MLRTMFQTKAETVTGFQVKRPHSDIDTTGDGSGQIEKKKFCMSLSSKGGGLGAANTGGPPQGAKLSMSLGTASSESRKVATSMGPSTQKPKAGPIKMNLSSQVS